MKIIDEIQKIILGYPVGEPIFSKDIVKVISGTNDLPLSSVSKYVPVAFRRLMDKGIKVKRFEKGIYYRYENCPFGETGINKNKIIAKKYLQGNRGYETGPAVLHAMGFTTLMSNVPRAFVSNAAASRSFTDKKFNIKIIKPKTLLSEKNIRYFQFLDLLKLIDEIPIDNEHPEIFLKKFVELYDLKPDIIVLNAHKFYNKNILEAVMSVVFGQKKENPPKTV